MEQVHEQGEVLLQRVLPVGAQAQQQGGRQQAWAAQVRQNARGAGNSCPHQRRLQQGGLHQGGRWQGVQQQQGVQREGMLQQGLQRAWGQWGQRLHPRQLRGGGRVARGALCSEALARGRAGSSNRSGMACTELRAKAVCICLALTLFRVLPPRLPKTRP